LFFKKKLNFDTNDLDSILRACAADDKLAQYELVFQFLGYARSVCRLYSANEMEVEEMVNDGFLKIFNNIHKYDFSKPFKVWLRAILINTSIDHYRKARKTDHIFPLESYHQPEVESGIIDQMAAGELMDIIQKLPKSYRMVFNLYVVEGYNHREISELLGIQEGTSKSNLRDARIKLQKMIHAEYEDRIEKSHFKTLNL
jgi:RNA polymerase sigma-70 factor (ECF subfamily)